ncbi:neuropeptide SIFamide receptor [Nilaparvata lugens]|uniref:Neuropeptide GPCR A5 n=1 Tax=Nilaparvata lugens TaxID=108931 RepID=U3U953_NILLU|nr:neuropeptide SIFamide receptor [Nilaparvata lugens]BAO01054.1 neuropeptide GPCR A5 [Nilaparvata lugens]
MFLPLSVPRTQVIYTASTGATGEPSRNELRYSVVLTVVFCVAYLLVFCVGVVGNFAVVAVVCRSPRMRTPTNLFIANLACADLLVNIICLPFTLISNIMTAWTMGWLVCKTIPYMQGVSVNASINTLVAISFERWLAICYPMRWQMTSRVCKLVILLIWLFSLTITLPWALFFQLRPMGDGSSMQTCLETWPTPYSENVYFVLANLVMCYLLPLALISICYFRIWRRVCCRKMPGEVQMYQELIIHRSKVKVIKMLFIVIVLFACSWLPLYVIFTRLKLGGDLQPWEEPLVYNLLPLAQWLGASNSCINPVLYAFFNKKFRAGFKAILSSKSCFTTLRYDTYSFDGRNLSSNYGNRNDTVKRPLTRMTISSSAALRTGRIGGSEGSLVRTRTLSFKAMNQVNNNSSEGPFYTEKVNGLTLSDMTLSANATFV